jgi:hypothetical protein
MMNSTIESLYSTIGKQAYAKLPDDGWKKATYTYRAITQMSEQNGRYFDENQKLKGFVLDDAGQLAFPKLREEMAKLHENGHAWYTAVFTLTPDGNFKFDFDYDHLPAFDVMPEPAEWLDEFKTYPRPELQALLKDWLEGTITYENDGSKLMSQRLKDLQSK